MMREEGRVRRQEEGDEERGRESEERGRGR